MVSMSMGMACSTRGFSCVASGPSRIDPNDISAASLRNEEIIIFYKYKNIDLYETLFFYSSSFTKT